MRQLSARKAAWAALCIRRRARSDCWAKNYLQQLLRAAFVTFSSIRTGPEAATESSIAGAYKRYTNSVVSFCLFSDAAPRRFAACLLPSSTRASVWWLEKEGRRYAPAARAHCASDADGLCTRRLLGTSGGVNERDREKEGQREKIIKPEHIPHLTVRYEHVVFTSHLNIKYKYIECIMLIASSVRCWPPRLFGEYFVVPASLRRRRRRLIRFGRHRVFTNI